MHPGGGGQVNRSPLKKGVNKLIKQGDIGEFVGQIIDIFEDFLAERNIDIPNEDKEQSGDEAAIIYGMDYGELQTAIEDTLHNWGLFEGWARKDQ